MTNYSGCWVLGVGCWVLGVGCWVLGVVNYQRFYILLQYLDLIMSNQNRNVPLFPNLKMSPFV